MICLRVNVFKDGGGGCGEGGCVYVCRCKCRGDDDDDNENDDDNLCDENSAQLYISLNIRAHHSRGCWLFYGPLFARATPPVHPRQAAGGRGASEREPGGFASRANFLLLVYRLLFV